jgi:hypothetical protein
MGGKEKVIEKTSEEIVNKGNMFLQYLPIVLGLICLVVCYLLFKKMQSLNSQNGSLENVEKQFTGFVKEQSEINAINAKRFNALVSQMNQVSYVVQNNNVRESNSVTSQMSPDREINNSNLQQQIHSSQEQPQQPQQREMMPTSVIQTNFPMNGTETRLPVPMNTSNKKESVNTIDNNIPGGKDLNKDLKKKVIDVQTLKEEVLIEEASSDDEE